MKFFRDSLTKKAGVLFILLFGWLMVAGIYLLRQEIHVLSANLVIGIIIGLLLFLMAVFILDVVHPMQRLGDQVKNLLTGRPYSRVKPTTVDEIGLLTHFFNEITHDLEKISYDVKERRRMSSELDIASQIQRDVLPKEAPNSPGLDIVAKTRAAAEVGGDSFDFLSSPDGNETYIYTGDVTGHGVPAGLVMMMVDTLIHSMVAMNMKRSSDVIVNTNAMLTPRISSRLFMTLVMLRWDAAAQKMFFTGAGHEHILIYRNKTEKVETIRSGGIALGMIPDISKIVNEQEIPLEIGDSIVLYTDGITEAKNKTGEMYGIERMQKSLEKCGYFPSSEGIFERMTKDFSEFVGQYVQADDTTMIVIKYTGEQSASKTKLTVNVEDTHGSKIWHW